jgi:hypothetical protein
MMFVPTIYKNFEINEEFLKLQSLTTGTKGSDVFEAINKVVSEFTSSEECSGIGIDGAKSMVGSKTGLGGHLKQLGIKCVFLHSIIHEEALCGKIVKMNQNMKRLLILSILFAEETKLKKHRAFIAFLEEMDADYGKITLYFDIRWLSAGNVCSFLR